MDSAKLKFDQPYNLIGIFKHVITGNIYCVLLDKPDQVTTKYRIEGNPFYDIKIDYYKPPTAIFTAINSSILFNLGHTTLFTQTYVMFELNNPYNYVLCDRLDLEPFRSSQESYETISFELHQLWHPSYKKPNREGDFFMENREIINSVIATNRCLPGNVIASSAEAPQMSADRIAAITEPSIHVDYGAISASDICAGSFTSTAIGYMKSWAFYSIPDIKEIIFDDPATIVYWKDGLKTIVRVADGEKFDKETGLAMAIAKRYFELLNKEHPRSEFIKAVKNAHVINKAQRKKQRKAEKEGKKNA